MVRRTSEEQQSQVFTKVKLREHRGEDDPLIMQEKKYTTDTMRATHLPRELWGSLHNCLLNLSMLTHPYLFTGF